MHLCDDKLNNTVSDIITELLMMGLWFIPELYLSSTPHTIVVYPIPDGIELKSAERRKRAAIRTHAVSDAFSFTSRCASLSAACKSASSSPTSSSIADSSPTSLFSPTLTPSLHRAPSPLPARRLDLAPP